ncbi:MAG: LysM peptidoglycan-binding domain-containing protein [Gallionella sp.]|nr:LysM peptidoglycan-binding domain-containing protein [Gallionella sp.]
MQNLNRCANFAPHFFTLLGFSMRKIISLICLLLPILASADELQIREDAPDRHIVVKGDTLWDISAKFFKDPWKWPQIWALNKEDIKDPHWIYPGNVVYLDRSSGTLTVNQPAATPETTTQTPPEIVVASGTPGDAQKLQPKARVVSQNSEAIPAIPLSVIGSFLSRPLVIENEELESAPRLVGTYEQRTLLSSNDVAYASNLPSDKGVQWQIYRPSVTFIDPDTKEELGREVLYLGDAVVEKFGDPSTMRITKAVLEINKDDHFAQATSGYSNNFLPHPPSTNINAKVISVYGGVQQAGQRAVITLNKGQRDGLEIGHVLGIYQKGEVIKTKGWFTPNIVLPDVRYGLVLVFRVFNKVSYALVMETKLPVQLLDRASTPE